MNYARVPFGDKLDKPSGESHANWFVDGSGFDVGSLSFLD